MSPMVTDILLQVFLLLLILTSFLSLFNIPQSLFRSFLRHRSRHSIQSRRHFVRAAQLLNQATLQKSRSLANQSITEADKGIALTPQDAAFHILKGMALDFQGHKRDAIQCFDNALSPLAVGSLSKEERWDALVKRAELRIKGKRGRGDVEGAVRDLEECEGKSGRVWCLLGDCYEVLKMTDKAKVAYGEALRVDGGSEAARVALERLGGD